MTVARVAETDRSVTTGVTPPTLAQITRALLALAHAVDAGQVTIIRDMAGQYTDVGTVGLGRIGDQVGDDIIAGMQTAQVEGWVGADSGWVYRDHIGLILSMRVRVHVLLGTVEEVAARRSVALAGAR